MDGFAIEKERVGAMAGRFVHVDEALDEGVHVVGGDTMLGHDLGGDGVVADFSALLEHVGAGMANRRGAAPDQLGAGGLEAGDESVEILFVLLGRGGPNAAGVSRHHSKGFHARDAVNQIAKPAVEMDEIPTALAKLLLEQLQGRDGVPNHTGLHPRAMHLGLALEFLAQFRSRLLVDLISKDEHPRQSLFIGIQMNRKQDGNDTESAHH